MAEHKNDPTRWVTPQSPVMQITTQTKRGLPLVASYRLGNDGEVELFRDGDWSKLDDGTEDFTAGVKACLSIFIS